MRKDTSLKNNKPVSRNTIIKVLKLRALLVATRKQRNNADLYDDIYCETLRLGHKKLYGMKKTLVLQKIKQELEKLPDLTHEDFLQPYPQLRHLGKSLSLSKTEQVILLLIVWLRQERALVEISSLIGTVSHHRLCNILSRLIKVSERKITACLRADSHLVRTGLIQREYSIRSINDIEDHYEFIEGLDESILRHRENWDNYIKSLFTGSFHSSLVLDNFYYISDLLSPVLQLLQGAITKRKKGAHILLYGPPGTGKTELAWALGKHLQADILTVNTKNNANGGSDGLARFRTYQLGQRLFKGTPDTVFVFDEMEDVFPSHFGIFFRDSSAFYKGYMNEELENTSLPTIWTANGLDFVDKAHLRRFDCIIEIPVPPKSVRKKLLCSALKQRRISEAWINRLADSRSLTPAEIASLGATVATTNTKGKEAEAVMETILSEKMRAMGHQPVSLHSKQDQIPYNMDYLNLDAEAEVFLRGLKQSQQGSLLFYGPPGTGKSALAKHISEKMDKPIIMKRASELLSMWLGMSEKNIAQAFHEAITEKAVLFLDEADSFLRSREGARHSWEVTQVNEMLVQMENFEGVFIAATNLIDNFDMAAFRRFDMKIRFECLTPEQRWEVFHTVLQEKPEHPEKLRLYYSNRLAQLEDLAIGDFRAAIRHLNIKNVPVTADFLFDALITECRFKNLDSMNRQPIGFINTMNKH